MSQLSSVSDNLQQPTIPVIQRSRHPDLQRISSETLVTLLTTHPVPNLLIIDARYPFEYAGGHIASAENIYTELDLRLLFSKLISSSTRPSIIVFHCEFSSERGPHLCRFFRSLDRQYNLSSYPYLTFPAIYLLDGGYAEFHQHSQSSQFCQPNAYISMFEQQHQEELHVHRRAKKVLNKKLIEHQQGPIQFCMS